MRPASRRSAAMRGCPGFQARSGPDPPIVGGARPVDSVSPPSSYGGGGTGGSRKYVSPVLCKAGAHGAQRACGTVQLWFLRRCKSKVFDRVVIGSRIPVF